MQGSCLTSRLRQASSAHHRTPTACVAHAHSVCAARSYLQSSCRHSLLRLSAEGQQVTRGISIVGLAVSGTKQNAPEKSPAEAIQVDGVTPHTVAPGVTLLRGSCTARLKYEVDYGLKRGSTDNAYVIKPPGSSSAVLIDVPNEAYLAQDHFVKALADVTPLDNLQLIIITHMDPKSVDSLESVIRAVLNARGSQVPDDKLQLALSNPALQLLQSLWGEKPDKAQLLKDVQLRIIKPARATGSTLTLPGSTVEVKLLPTPTPRWPDLMAVHYPPEELLFTSKLFSAQVAPSLLPGGAESAFDTNGWDAYGSDWRHFFDCMLAPVARQAASALTRLNIEVAPAAGPSAVLSSSRSSAAQRGGKLLAKLLDSWAGAITKLTGTPAAGAVGAAAAAALETAKSPSPGDGNGSAAASPTTAAEALRVRSICPMHGPVVSIALSRLLRDYNSWVNEQITAAGEALVMVLYASAYGNTAALAQAISRGVTKGGVAVDTLNLELVSTDEITKALQNADGFVIGSPTLGGHLPTQVQLALGALLRETSTKQLPCGVFGSFGWSGEAVDEMEQRLRDAGFGFAFKAIRVKFKPTAKDLQLCEESGRALAQSVKRRLKARELKPASGERSVVLASGPQLAMGRVLGSLCVLTARDEDASSAMLASWVSQASFDPPGLTVSVKKDRALEPLLVSGGKFTLSTIAEGEERPVMKRLSRSFSPGEDRLEGLETSTSELTGCPILNAANSYLDCQVQSRMEAGDHWLVYAAVIGGKVLKEDAATAMHHRKVGNHY